MRTVSIEAGDGIADITATAGEASAALTAAAIKTPMLRNFAIATAKVGQRSATIGADADHAGLETSK